MPTKIGAGGENQPYDKSNGQYTAGAYSSQSDGVQALAKTVLRKQEAKRQKPENKSNDDVSKPKRRRAIDEYNEIQQKYPNSIIAQQLGDFYVIYGENAIKVANELDLNYTIKTDPDGTRIPTIGFPFHQFDRYASDLTDKGQAITVAESNGGVYHLSAKSKKGNSQE